MMNIDYRTRLYYTRLYKIEQRLYLWTKKYTGKLSLNKKIKPVSNEAMLKYAFLILRL